MPSNEGEDSIVDAPQMLFKEWLVSESKKNTDWEHAPLAKLAQVDINFPDDGSPKEIWNYLKAKRVPKQVSSAFVS